ncbi:hypothetical protein CTAYLR_006623 [Chrysophaeum taylorii]|uniref:WW domain-containing protein n=1 Tax=Chrysophaeum taylorii TaxID=2483200 RepID=A0AAD7ULB1_9STRA|nr:hypothetical protein CTAYLR_006623 [Chrysophaeum taylorii]
MPRSAMATLERARRRKSLLGRDESATRPPHPPRIRRQRDADAKRAESGKSAVLRRRLADYNLGGGEASPRAAAGVTPTVAGRAARTSPAARKKVEPTGRTPRVFGQPWTEPPPPPPTTRLPKGTARRSSTPSNRSDRALSRTAASRRDSLDTIATEETGISPRRRPTTPRKDKEKKKTPATNQDAPTEVVVDAARPPTLAEPVPFELWLDDLVRHSSNAERAVDVLKKLRKARAAPSNDIAPSDRERLVQPFRETLARLTALARRRRRRDGPRACVSAPDQLKLAALSWGRARALVAQLRVLVDALFDDAAALDASTVSPETPALADRALKHPLANLAMRLEVELGRINETSKPADDDDDGGGGGGGNTTPIGRRSRPCARASALARFPVLSTPARRPSLSSFAPSPRASRSIDDKDDDSAATVRKPASPPPTPADDAPLQEEVIREEEVPGSVDDPEVIQEEEVPGSVDPAPTDAPSEEEDSTVAPSESPAWREGYDNTYEQFFYFNDNTGESIWTKPSGPFKPYEASTSSDDDDQGDEFTAASSQ